MPFSSSMAPAIISLPRCTIPENVTLVRLPPYAPELNPIENDLGISAR